MKKLKSLICMFIVLISIATMGVTAIASEAETPKTEYIRNGVTYRMSSQLLKETDPGFESYLNQISKELFQEEPIIYLYVIDQSLSALNGFQVTYDDGSKAIYLKAQEYWSAIQVFIHEMVHYKYDSDGAIFYKRNIHGKYLYRTLMEQITDEIAKREYSKLTNEITYQKAYTSEIFEKIIEEDTDDILISLYKGEYNLSDEIGEKVEDVLAELENATTFESAKIAFEKLKQELEKVPLGTFFIYKEINMNYNRKTLIISIISIIVLISTIVVTVLNVIKNVNNQEQLIVSEYSTDYIETHEMSEVFYDNGWTKDYISDIKEDVPIPQGYEYVQGQKETGLVVKDKDNHYYMWIPYNEDAEIKNIDEYYKNVSDQGRNEVDVDTSIKTYNGFYISLSNTKTDYSKLKSLNDKNYKSVKNEIKKEGLDNEATNINVISKIQLEQVLYFTQQNNINFVNLSNNNSSDYIITKLSNGNNEVTEEEKWHTGLTGVTVEGWYNPFDRVKVQDGLGYSKWKSTTGQIVYVPNGFEINNNEQYITIRCINNRNIEYVWISTEYIDENSDVSAAQQVRNQLLSIFDDFNKQNGSDVKYGLEDETTILNPDMEYSLKKFKGFYMARSATKIDADGNIYANITGTKNYKPDMDGDYIRLKSNQDIQSWMVYINDIASKQLSENFNVNSTVVPLTGFEALFAEIGKEDPKLICENNGQDNMRTMEGYGKDIPADETPTIHNMIDIGEGVYNTSGNQGKENYNVKESKNPEGEKEITTTSQSYVTSTDITKTGTITMDKKPQTDIDLQEEGTIGFRLAIFLSDINRHAQYFDIDGNGTATLKNDSNVPEDLVIPKYVLDSNGKEKRVENVVCTGNTKIKTVTDRVTYDIPIKAYYNCSNLQSINKTYIVGIGDSAFENCTNLSEINMSQTTYMDLEKAEIHKNAFKNCKSLKKFVAGKVEAISCEFKQLPDKRVYNENEELEINGGILTVKYNDGSEEEIILDAEDPNLSILGSEVTEYNEGIQFNKKTLKIIYGEVSTFLDIYILKGKKYNNFQWNEDKLNFKTTYGKGEEFDFNGVAIAYSYTSDDVKTNKADTKITDYIFVKSKYILREVSKDGITTESKKYPNHIVGDFWNAFIKVNGYNKNQPGKQEVTVSFGEYGEEIFESKTFEVEVMKYENTNTTNKAKEENENNTIIQPEENNDVKAQELQNYEVIYASAFEGCESLERIMVGKVNKFYDFEEKEYNLASDTQQKEEIKVDNNMTEKVAQNINVTDDKKNNQDSSNNQSQANSKPDYITSFMSRLKNLKLLKIGDITYTNETSNGQSGGNTNLGAENNKETSNSGDIKADQSQTDEEKKEMPPENGIKPPSSSDGTNPPFPPPTN